MKAEQPLQDMELQEKEAQKDWSIQETCFRKNQQLKDVTKIIGQRKAFYRQRIPGCSCARKETVDIDILEHLGMETEKSCSLSE